MSIWYFLWIKGVSVDFLHSNRGRRKFLRISSIEFKEYANFCSRYMEITIDFSKCIPGISIIKNIKQASYVSRYLPKKYTLFATIFTAFCRLAKPEEFQFILRCILVIAMWVGPRRLALALPVTQSKKQQQQQRKKAENKT